MGFMRKALFVSTGGLSGVAGVKANSKKERAAKAAEKQLRLQKQQLKAAKSAARAQSATQTTSHQQPQPMQPTSTVSTPQNPAPANPSLAAELERLAALHRDGALSDEEFATAKGRLLGPASVPAPRQVLACSVGPCTEPRTPGSNYCPKPGPKRSTGGS
jgi:hypothetical protein